MLLDFVFFSQVGQNKDDENLKQDFVVSFNSIEVNEGKRLAYEGFYPLAEVNYRIGIKCLGVSV